MVNKKTALPKRKYTKKVATVIVNNESEELSEEAALLGLILQAVNRLSKQGKAKVILHVAKLDGSR